MFFFCLWYNVNMNVRKKAAFCRLLVLLLAAFILTFCQPASALSDALKKRYGDYQVYFYNGEKDYEAEDDEWEDVPCIPRSENESDDPPAPYDGHCSGVNSYSSKIEQYYDSIYSVAQRNGLPWEGIVAQLIGESSFMQHEACPYNPLGLKGSPNCDGKHRSFSSYDEAFSYYVNNIRPVREAKGKFKNDPYGYVDFLINGVPGYKYATDPNYVYKVSGYVCGVQKWAKEHGKPISGSGKADTSSSSGTQTTTGGSNTSDTSGGYDSDLPYCEEDEEIDDDDDEEDSDDDGGCEAKGNCSDYVFPLKGATKSNYLHGSSLSPLPCNNLSKGGCHHDYYAMDLGLKTGTKNENDYPDLKGKFSASYWYSTGVKVVAMTSGKIISYKPYGRATLGYNKKCASVTYQTNDGRKFWLGHMSYDSKRKAGDTFGTGDVIGEVGPPPCAISTQAHLHVDETITHGSGGTVNTVKLINLLYNKLP